MATVVYEALACGDCTMLIANDDTSGASDGYNEAVARDHLYGTDLQVVLIDHEEEFNDTACAVCKTHLAGYRHGIAYLSE